MADAGQAYVIVSQPYMPYAPQPRQYQDSIALTGTIIWQQGRFQYALILHSCAHVTPKLPPTPVTDLCVVFAVTPCTNELVDQPVSVTPGFGEQQFNGPMQLAKVPLLPQQLLKCGDGNNLAVFVIEPATYGRTIIASTCNTPLFDAALYVFGSEGESEGRRQGWAL